MRKKKEVAVKRYSRARKTTMAIALVLVLAVLYYTNGLAQSGAPGICTGEELSPCGFPIDANPAEMVGNATIHDSCNPEGACPWIQGVDIWWPDKAGPDTRPTQLVSVMRGKIINACNRDGVNNKVITVQNDYYTAYYLHADSCLVEYGQDVEVGTPIGIMGNTGRSSLPHLHFALKLRSEQYSLRLNELLPILQGWSKVSGMDPAPVTYFGSQPGDIKISDLPYAQAGEVVWVVPYTPTPVMPTAVPTLVPTVIPPVVDPTPTVVSPMPEVSSETKTRLLWAALGLLVLAWLCAPRDSDHRGRRVKHE